MSVNAKVESESYSLNWLKWLIVAALIVLGVWGNGYYDHVYVVYRALALLAFGCLSLWVVIQTPLGSKAWKVIKESQTEIRKVVWPTRQETNQTALIVVVLTIIMALILWGLDTFIGWLASLIIG